MSDKRILLTTLAVVIGAFWLADASLSIRGVTPHQPGALHADGVVVLYAEVGVGGPALRRQLDKQAARARRVSSQAPACRAASAPRPSTTNRSSP